MVFNRLLARENFCTEGVFRRGLVESEECIRFKNIVRYKQSYGVTAVALYSSLVELKAYVYLVRLGVFERTGLILYIKLSHRAALLTFSNQLLYWYLGS
jgi:hypothetical protein